MRKPSRRNKTCKWRAHVRSLRTAVHPARSVLYNFQHRGVEGDATRANARAPVPAVLARTHVSRCRRVLFVWWAAPTAATRDGGVIWQKRLVQPPHLRITLLPRERAQALDVGDHGAVPIDWRRAWCLCGVAIWKNIEPAASASGDGCRGKDDQGGAPGVAQGSVRRPRRPMCIFHGLRFSARGTSLLGRPMRLNLMPG